ncbi:hypothetical protein [Micrococcus sp.]|uniref:hypothetical protein n=1 Tax=Micrococcus sp. TaxID=1271 RepID=UPI002A9145E4|nr:hypothetical protein [Micrococcus sp.]MDY6054537.1 hypothetical protein [Micrococcus sp.]
MPFDTRQGGIFKNHLVVYMGVGKVRFYTGFSAWIRRILLRWNPTPITVQAFGSADNYASWSSGEMREKIMSEGWYPSSPGGLVDLLSREYELTDKFKIEERSKERRDIRSPGQLSKKFDDIIVGRFHNAHKSNGTIPQIDGTHKINPKVRVIGYVNDVHLNHREEVDAVLIRPIIISASRK